MNYVDVGRIVLYDFNADNKKLQYIEKIVE